MDVDTHREMHIYNEIRMEIPRESGERIETQKNGEMEILCTLDNMVQDKGHWCFCCLDTVTQKVYLKLFPNSPNVSR